MLQPLSAPSAAQTAYALSPQSDGACLNLSAPMCDRTAHRPLHAVAEHASAHGYGCSEGLSLSLLSVTALRAGSLLSVVSAVPGSTGEEAPCCEGKSRTEVDGKRSGTEGREYVNRS